MVKWQALSDRWQSSFQSSYVIVLIFIHRLNITKKKLFSYKIFIQIGLIKRFRSMYRHALKISVDTKTV